MKTLLNIIWFVFSGLWLWLSYVLAGIVACVLIITIPFGIASFRFANYAVWPFGRTVVERPGAGLASGVGNIIWFLCGGLGIAIVHLVTAFFLALTIIGIPMAVANIKLIPVALFPLGKEIVSDRELARRAHENRGMPAYGQHF